MEDHKPEPAAPLRGLVAWSRRENTGRGRAVVPHVSAYHRPIRPRGYCIWCGRACNKGAAWHSKCVTQYALASGLTYSFGRPLLKRAPCTCGRPGNELDHELALSVAKLLGSRRLRLRSVLRDNLRWLCRDCHARKTASDRKLLAAIRREPSGDWNDAIPVRYRQ